MKILTRKQVDEILKRITANEIMCIEYVKHKDMEAFAKMIENRAEITYIVGGVNGMYKVKNSVSNYINKYEVEYE